MRSFFSNQREKTAATLRLPWLDESQRTKMRLFRPILEISRILIAEARESAFDFIDRMAQGYLRNLLRSDTRMALRSR